MKFILGLPFCAEIFEDNTARKSANQNLTPRRVVDFKSVGNCLDFPANQHHNYS